MIIALFCIAVYLVGLFVGFVAFRAKWVRDCKLPEWKQRERLIFRGDLYKDPYDDSADTFIYVITPLTWPISIFIVWPASIIVRKIYHFIMNTGKRIAEVDPKEMIRNAIKED